MKKVLLAGFIGLWATAALAHSPLKSTTPANEATVAEVPAEVLLGFKGGIRLTRLSMTHADHPSVDMDLSGHDGFVTDYAIPLEPMGSGVYMFEWRGLGADGHAVNGSFNFTAE